MFQFQMVRLKGEILNKIYKDAYVSIPNGTIKRYPLEELDNLREVSIPNGTIKSICRQQSERSKFRFNSKWYD